MCDVSCGCCVLDIVMAKGMMMRGKVLKYIMDRQTKLPGITSNLLNKLTTVRDTNKLDGILWFIFISMFVCLISFIVYLTGGTNAYVHLMYIPILLSVFIFEPFASALICIFAGFMVGPFMPYNVEEHIMQTPESWLFRCVMFFIVMLIVQILTTHIRTYNDLEAKKAYEDIFTGYPNFNKWKNDFSQVTDEKGNHYVVLFEITNLDTIIRNVDYNTGQEVFKQLLEMCTKTFRDSKVYAANHNRIILTVPSESPIDPIPMIRQFIRDMKKPIYCRRIPVAVILKAGVVTVPEQGSHVEEIAVKLEKSLDQAIHSQKEIVQYSREIAEKISRHYETLAAIYHGFQKNEFHLVYQPKVNIQTGAVRSTEALLRWNNNPYHDLNVAEMIRIAEDAGFITIITRWVIKNAVYQISEWEKQGKDVAVSVNLSSRDLIDETIVNYTAECIREAGIQPRHLEFELTERSMIEDEEKTFAILSAFQKSGIKISLDDYGTGHNSLVYLVRSLFRFDSIKIEKMFIDEIASPKTQALIEGIVKTAHESDIQVITEGVETKLQFDIIKELGCDTVQGYYFSRPVMPDELRFHSYH